MRMAAVVAVLISMVLVAVVLWQQAQLAARDQRLYQLEQALQAYHHVAERFEQWQEDHLQTERELRARQRAEAEAKARAAAEDEAAAATPSVP